jgi:2',3'-cyclic-nucleotide 2'-phosphodiesterase (5'-nucleotidase family)
MSPRLLHYSDIERAHDDPEQVGRLAGTVDALREDDAVVVGAGDDTAPGVLALVSGGRQALSFFDAVDPDVETFGNHDFDHGVDATRSLVEDAPVTWLSANVRTADGDPFAGVAPGTVLDRGGARVGLLGVSDPASSIPETLVVTDPAESAASVADNLRAEGADYVVAVAHLRDEPARAVARLSGIDVVLAGHVHRVDRELVDGTPLLRPGANGDVVWEVDLDGPTATRHQTADGPLDEAVAERFRAMIAEAGLDEVVARVAGPIPRERARCFTGDCSIGDAVTEAYRWATDADVGYVDTRMLREGTPLVGEVTAADLVSTAPFEADLHVLSVTGAELRALAEETVFADDPRAERSDIDEIWWATTSGMAVDWDDRERRVSSVRVGGDPVDPDETYSLATTGYVVGADEFPTLGPDRVADTWGVQYEAVVEYARSEGLKRAMESRR